MKIISIVINIKSYLHPPLYLKSCSFHYPYIILYMGVEWLVFTGFRKQFVEFCNVSVKSVAKVVELRLLKI